MRSVQILANLAVVAASACLIWMILQRPWTQASGGPDVYAVGDSIGQLNGVDFSTSTQTLVMALREKCPFCQMSIPFYQKLTNRLRHKASRTDLRIVVASTDEPEAMAGYLSSKNVDVDQVVQYRPGSLKIPGTPFLFMADQTGHVTRVWRGKLDAAKESEVFAALGVER